MRVAVLANLKANAPVWEGMPHDQWDDLDTLKSVGAIVDALRSGGHTAEFFEAQVTPPHDLIARLTEWRPDICFNIAESHLGDGREAQIPAVLEMLRIPYTGARVLAQSIALDKAMTKRIAAYYGLPTPEYQVFHHADDPISPDLITPSGDLRFPLFVKPNSEGTSMGVTVESIIRTPEALRQRVSGHIARYRQPILVERYIQGREVMVGMIGNCPPFDPRRHTPADLPRIAPDLHIFSILEMDVSLTAPTEGDLYTSEMKKDLAVLYRYHCPAPLSDEQTARLRYLSAALFSIIDAKDVARIDLRLDAHDHDAPYILEINTLPGLTPSFSDLCVQAESDGWAYERLVNGILDAAARRWGLV
jgi:D-alanine-D-alanine ligase